MEKLEKSGLMTFVTAHTEKFFEEDVADFFEHASVDKASYNIKSTVNGQAVKVTPTTLAEVLNLPVNGVEDVKGYRGSKENSVWHDMTGMTTGMPFPFKKDLLNPQYYMLVDVVGKIVECRAESHDKVTKLRFKIMSLSSSRKR